MEVVAVTDKRTFKDVVDAGLQEALKELADDAPSASAPLTVQKLGHYMPVTCCMLTDATGEDHCEHLPKVYPPLPWTFRVRERWAGLRERVARWIAGDRWLEENE